MCPLSRKKIREVLGFGKTMTDVASISEKLLQWHFDLNGAVDAREVAKEAATQWLMGNVSPL